MWQKQTYSGKKGQKMSKEILQIAEGLANERGLKKADIYSAIEAALATATAKKYADENVNIRVSINQQDGSYETFRCWTVVNEENYYSEDHEILLEDALKEYPHVHVGDVIEDQIESIAFGRIAAQQAKQVIMTKVREAERNRIVDDYRSKIGQLVTGTVKRVTREHLILDLMNNVEALLAREDMIPRESFRVNDRVRAYICGVRDDMRGAQLQVSRAAPEFLTALFAVEVPEIAEQLIEIMAAARDVGSRAKIVVKTNDGRIDPIGACVGMRGSRVQAVSNELNGERIDIVLWDANPAQLVINAMSPAEVVSIVGDEETKTMDIAVKQEQLSQAIGRGGQNVRLASDLTGWKLNVMSEEDLVAKQENESTRLRKLFMHELGVDEDLSDLLVAEGYRTIEEIALVEPKTLLEIAELDDEIVLALQTRAKEIHEERKKLRGSGEPEQDLLDLPKMTHELAWKLADQGVKTRDDLAELATDELLAISNLSKTAAAELIMAARAHWFK
jgi:N utilization substance protein A